MEEIRIRIEGMTCSGCVRNVTDVLQAIAGVNDVRVSLEDAEARVSCDPARVSAEQLRQVVTDAGFDAPQ